MAYTDSQLISAVEVLPGNACDNRCSLKLVEQIEVSAGVLVAEAMGDAARTSPTSAAPTRLQDSASRVRCGTPALCGCALVLVGDRGHSALRL